MKNIANYLTIGNLVSGCIAIVFIMSAKPYFSEGNMWIILRDNQLLWGSVFIFIAAVFDFFDGMVARALKIYSPIGKDLDSLADIVSFGVAPSMIAYQGLWSSYMNHTEALDVSMMAVLPAFLLAAAGAWRLAVFNQREPQKHFVGMPIPTVGIFIASLPMVYATGNPPAWVRTALINEWVWYLIIFCLAYLMNSKIPFLSPKMDGFGLAKNKSIYIILVLAIALLIVFKWAAIPIITIL